MRKLLFLHAGAALALACLLAACAAGEHEVVLTADQLGEDWPLRVNSATVVCSEKSGVVLKLGPRRYALDEASAERGLPPAREVVREIPVDPDHPEIGAWPADTEPLRAVCAPAVATR